MVGGAFFLATALFIEGDRDRAENYVATGETRGEAGLPPAEEEEEEEEEDDNDDDDSALSVEQGQFLQVQTAAVEKHQISNESLIPWSLSTEDEPIVVPRSGRSTRVPVSSVLIWNQTSVLLSAVQKPFKVYF